MTMKVRGSLARAARTYAFVRHMPVSKLVRRFELNLRRRLSDRIGGRAAWTLSAGANMARAAAAPLPLLPARAAGYMRLERGHSFTFLNRSVAMGDRIDWMAPGNGPENQLWRMNLHYMEYLEGVADDAFCTLVEQWIEANTLGRPGSWRDAWNSYTLSLRTVVWMQQIARRAGTLPCEFVEKASASVGGQIAFLARHLETDLGGNHLVKNIKALIWGAAFYSGSEAAEWRRRALQLLDRELARQVLPDGMHDERSASYHAQIFVDLLECRAVLGADPFGGRFDAAIDLMAQVTADLAHPDGGPVLLNDSGLTMAYPPAACMDAYAHLTGKRPQPRKIFALEYAGLFGARSPESYLVADCGRIAPDDLPAHGHGDALSFEWSVGGKRMIVDQGVYEYNAGERRQRARSAASHNTLCIDGADQADFFGAFRCGRRPDVIVRHYAVRPDGFVLEGSHDGFRHLEGAPVHVRRFEVGERRIRIVDWLEGTSTLRARIGLLLHPDVKVTVDDGVAALACGPARTLVRSSKPMALEDAVWWPDMGQELATHRLVVYCEPGEAAIEMQLEIL
jgi:uncharacterized heparinase superfamily protein